MIEKFVTLVDSTRKSLEERNIKINNIALVLKNFNIKLSSYPEDMAQILMSASDHWSFFNYGILESLIKKYGDHNDNKRMATYISEFKDYCKRRISEVPIDTLKSDRKVTTRLCVKTGKNFQVPMEDIKLIQVKLSELLGTPRLILLDVNDGCIELDFDYFREENLLALRYQEHSDETNLEETFVHLGITKLYTNREVFYNNIKSI